MKIAVIGPGAMGSLFAAGMKAAGADVTLVDKNSERARRLNSEGIILSGVGGERKVTVPCRAEFFPGETFDFIFVMVKAYDTETAMTMHRGLVGKESLVISIQNGYGNVEALARVVPSAQTAAGITSQGANLIAPGRVVHAGTGDTYIGELSGADTPRLRSLKKILDAGGFPASITDKLEELIFSKLIINVGINALTAILRVKNGRLNENEAARKLMHLAVEEALAIAGAKGLLLPSEKTQVRVAEVATLTAKNRSSMLMDILRQRSTEIDFINGAIVREGQKLGIPVPVNTTLWLLVKTLENTHAVREELN